MPNGDAFEFIREYLDRGIEPVDRRQQRGADHADLVVDGIQPPDQLAVEVIMTDELYAAPRAPRPSVWARLVWVTPLLLVVAVVVAPRLLDPNGLRISLPRYLFFEGLAAHHATATAGRGQHVRRSVRPRPFDPGHGAPLPADRVIAVYGILFGAESNGFASSLDMLNGFLPQLDQLSRQYAVLDPTHGVREAVDLVVNPLKPCNEDPRWCSYWPDRATIEAYVDFCRRHHLLLFFDLQLGTEPVRDAILNHLMPYLTRYPFAEVALDTEFHFPNTPAGYSDAQNYPCCLGWMDAGEINWAITELAKVSLRYHLPRKVLVVHQWDPSVIHNKNQIRLNPNVSVVIQSDGWGAAYYKVSNYSRFVQQSLVEYGGYKLFLPHMGDLDVDAPIQTPQQVMQLFPQPLFISYQ